MTQESVTKVIIKTRTELEGLIPTYGDLIAIAHDMPSWGQGAEVIAVDDNVLSLSEPLEWSEELGDHFISLRKADGSVSGPWLILPGETPSQVVLQDELDFTPYTGELQELGRVEGTPAADDGPAHSPANRRALAVLHADRSPALEQDAVGQGVRLDGQVGPVSRRVQVGDSRAPADAVDVVEWEWTHAGGVGVVMVR